MADTAGNRIRITYTTQPALHAQVIAYQAKATNQRASLDLGVLTSYKHPNIWHACMNSIFS